MNIFRRKKERNQGYVSSGGGGAVTVSQNPNAETESGSGGQRLGALGAKIRNSRSLQSLEVATMDGVRQMVDTATNMGGSMVSRYIMGKYCILCVNICRVRYGSRVELQNRSKYDKFRDDPDYDSDSEDRFRRS